MIKFKFNNATITAPNCWEEVSVEYFIKPEFLTKDTVSLLSALSGIPRKDLMNTKEDIEADLQRMVQFYIDDPEGFRRNMPRPIKVMGKLVTIPLDIELERLGQKIMFQNVLSKHQFIYQAIPEAIAIYIIPSITEDGSFDDTLIDEVVEEIKKLPIVDVFPIADFFLSSLRS